jgi:hypothetical protein
MALTARGLHCAVSRARGHDCPPWGRTLAGHRPGLGCVTGDKPRDPLLHAARIDKHPDELIGRIETQLKQKHTTVILFTIRWRTH